MVKNLHPIGLMLSVMSTAVLAITLEAHGVLKLPDTTNIHQQEAIKKPNPDSASRFPERLTPQASNPFEERMAHVETEQAAQKSALEVWITLFAIIIAGFAWGFSILFKQNAEIKVLQEQVRGGNIQSLLHPKYFMDSQAKILAWTHVLGGGTSLMLVWMILLILSKTIREVGYSPLYFLSVGGLGGSIGLIRFYHYYFKDLVKKIEEEKVEKNNTKKATA